MKRKRVPPLIRVPERPENRWTVRKRRAKKATGERAFEGRRRRGRLLVGTTMRTEEREKAEDAGGILMWNPSC
jgi:hypothetical protein